jgi:hypothetical protein
LQRSILLHFDTSIDRTHITMNNIRKHILAVALSMLAIQGTAFAQTSANSANSG